MDVKVFDKDLCFTCVHRHNQTLDLCDEYVINKGASWDESCKYKKESATMIQIVICEKCSSIIEMCRCKQPKFIKRMV